MAKRKTTSLPDDKYERDEQGIVGEKPEVRLTPGHHQGPRGQYGGPGYGYTLNTDGSYELAPGQQTTFDEIAAQINTVHNLVNSIFDHARKQLHDLEKRKTAWFQDVARTIYRDEDLSKLSYLPSRGVITVATAPPKGPLSKDLRERIDIDKAGAGTGKEPQDAQ